ncbi:MAG: AAA family ATPase [bacterium]
MLRELGIRDFCCFEDITLDLHKQGLIWVGGQNNDTEAATSNGSGKSTLFKALTWGLFGQTIDGERGDKVIRHGAKEASVAVALEGGWLIQRVRKKGSTRLALTKSALKVDGDKKALQDKINELLGLDFHAFKNTVLFGQNDTTRFANPMTRDADRKDMLHRLLRTEVLKECHKNVLARVRKTKEVLAGLESAEHIHASTRAEALDRATSVRSSLLAWNIEQSRRIDSALVKAKEFKANANAILKEAPNVDEMIELAEKYEAAISKAEEQQKTATAARTAAAELRIEASTHGAKAAVATSAMTSARTELDELDGDNCPVCGSPLDGEHAAQHIESVKSDLVKAEAERDRQRAECNRLNAEAQIKENEAKSLEKKASTLPRLRKRLAKVQSSIHAAETVAERAKGMVSRARTQLKRSKEIQAESNPHRVHLEEAEKSAKKAEGELKKVKGELHAYRKLQSHQEFWVRGFSGQGLPSFILDAVVPIITERANVYLGVLSDGDIVIDISTQRELKAAKGEFRDELDIQWTIEGVDNYPPSGGQQRKMEIAVDLALMDLAESREGSRLDLFIADEILDGLDVEGTERVVQLLQVLRKRRGTIFVVSHQPSMGEAFEQSINVVKDGGVSTLERSK